MKHIPNELIFLIGLAIGLMIALLVLLFHIYREANNVLTIYMKMNESRIIFSNKPPRQSAIHKIIRFFFIRKY